MSDNLARLSEGSQLPLGHVGARPVHVVHVVESFAAGVLSVIAQWERGLADLGFVTTIIHSARPETPQDFRSLFSQSARFIYLPMSRGLDAGADGRALVRLTQLLSQLRPDIVHLHSSKAGFLGRVATRMARIERVFYSPHGFSFYRQDASDGSRRMYRFLERLGRTFGGTVVACSRGEYVAASSLGANVILLQNAVDVDAIDEAAGNLVRFESLPVTVATLGRITPQRFPEAFADVARLVGAEFPGSVRFMWIGDGESHHFAGSPVQTTGWLPRDEALRLLAAEAAIYLHLSRWEGLSMALLEAMTLRKPAVATNIVGNEDAVIDGETGYLVEGVDEAAERVARLVSRASLRSTMGRAARARVEAHFSAARQIEDLYRIYMGRNGAARRGIAAA